MSIKPTVQSDVKCEDSSDFKGSINNPVNDNESNSSQKCDDASLQKKERFKCVIAGNAAIASRVSKGRSYDEAKQISLDSFDALRVEDGVQAMVAAQMLTVHKLQQEVMVYANGVEDIRNKQYFVNSAVKLTNCFTQQAALLARLQGNLGQKMTVERVDVHDGGQAVVGNVAGLNRTDKAKK